MSFRPGAIIRGDLHVELVGLAGVPVSILASGVANGDTLVVVQDLAGCRGAFATQLTVACVDPPVGPNPSSYDLFPVGSREYSQGDTRGSVYYPAQDDGQGQPFNERLSQVGFAPVVFMAHGNHDPGAPSYQGYDYFQAQLAKMGIIAVSIDCNRLNGGGGGVQNIEDRADLIIENIGFFQALNADPTSVFFRHIDLTRVGLMGHSRGGDAVVTVPTVIAMAGVTLKSVLALAPTNFRFWAGLSSIQPSGRTFMTIRPAGDGAGWENNGAQFYDLAKPGPTKTQVYVHFANHNFFNRQWPDDDSLWSQPQPPVMARSDHERVLSAYGCALFRATLLGQATLGYLDGTVLSAGVLTQNVHLSHQRTKALTVDNHEDGNGIQRNSLNQPTTQLAGMSADEFNSHNGAGAFNGSFFGAGECMVAKPGRPGRIFRSALGRARCYQSPKAGSARPRSATAKA